MTRDPSALLRESRPTAPRARSGSRARPGPASAGLPRSGHAASVPSGSRFSLSVAQPSPPAQPAPYSTMIIVDPSAGRKVVCTRHSGRSVPRSRTRVPSSSGDWRSIRDQPSASNASAYQVATVSTSSSASQPARGGLGQRVGGQRSRIHGELLGDVDQDPAPLGLGGRAAAVAVVGGRARAARHGREVRGWGLGRGHGRCGRRDGRGRRGGRGRRRGRRRRARRLRRRPPRGRPARRTRAAADGGLGSASAPMVAVGKRTGPPPPQRRGSCGSPDCPGAGDRVGDSHRWSPRHRSSCVGPQADRTNVRYAAALAIAGRRPRIATNVSPTAVARRRSSWATRWPVGR